MVMGLNLADDNLCVGLNTCPEMDINLNFDFEVLGGLVL